MSPSKPKLAPATPAAAPAPAAPAYAPVRGDRVRLYSGRDGVNVTAEVTNVQGPHPGGGHVVDVVANPDGQDRDRVFSVRVLADREAALALTIAGLIAYPESEAAA